jgi:3-oxoacyl-[acyl-carrier protein] reductase
VLLKGKRVIVTGGLTGIGKASVLACVENGAAVVSMSRKEPTHPTAEQLLAETGAIRKGSTKHMAVDITDQQAVFTAFDEAVAWMGGLDALIHSAAGDQVKPAEELTPADINEQLNLHVNGTIYTNQGAFKHMKATGGSIINHGSIAGLLGKTEMSAYSAGKGAVVAWSRTIAQEWGKYLIRINMCCPAVETELVTSIRQSMNAEQLAAFENWEKSNIILGGRMGDVKHAANMNVFLASDLSSFVHGQLMMVDGGMVFSR